MSKLIRLALSGLLALACSATAVAATSFPVRYSPDQRYLVDQNGVPFPIMGRTAWFVLSLAVGEYQIFLDDTAGRGHDAIELHVINHDPRGNIPPFNGNGDMPFLKRLDGTAWNGNLTYRRIDREAPDFATPNEAYWSFVDEFLAHCESKGILVFLFPAYVGAKGGDQGWMAEILANGAARMQSYGAWIASRYRTRKNLVWMMGGDMGTPPNAFDTAQSNIQAALLGGLKSVPGQQSTLVSAEWASESIATDQVALGASMTLNGVYSWSGNVNSHARRAYSHSPVMPAFLLEEPYDEEGPDGNGVNPSATQPVRRFQWWGWLSTIGGYISGNGYVWPFRTPAWYEWRGWRRAIKGYFADTGHVWPFQAHWRAHLDTQGARDMGRLNAFIRSISWHKLVPSGLAGMRNLIIEGGASPNSSTYVAAAADPDGTLMIAYVPPAHVGPVSVDMAAMVGPTRARWFDPTSGAFRDIATGLANSGQHTFASPGPNSAGSADWVLLLESPRSGP